MPDVVQYCNPVTLYYNIMLKVFCQSFGTDAGATGATSQKSVTIENYCDDVF